METGGLGHAFDPPPPQLGSRLSAKGGPGILNAITRAGAEPLSLVLNGLAATGPSGKGHVEQGSCTCDSPVGRTAAC